MVETAVDVATTLNQDGINSGYQSKGFKAIR